MSSTIMLYRERRGGGYLILFCIFAFTMQVYVYGITPYHSRTYSSQER